MPKRVNSDLKMAVRRIAEASRTVEQQRRQIGRLRKAGKPTIDQEQTFRTLESILQIFEVYERVIRQQGRAATVDTHGKVRGEI